MGYGKIIFHVDVNSAFLSWSATDRLLKGEELDIRTIPAVIGHDENRGVVLAKSESAKGFHIVTGESILTAKRKCPELKIIHPDFKIYNHYSSLMVELFNQYTPYVEQYSIDECFLDMTNFLDGEPIAIANNLRERIYNELGFTVNIGISSNKILAKMGSELKKPNRVHTLWREEMETKLWPLPVGELFMVGRKSAKKLNDMGIFTIGELAKYNEVTLKKSFKSYGSMIYKYANGIDESQVESNEDYQIKIISNANTFQVDITCKREAHKALLALVENVASRLRKSEKYCTCISINIRNNNFKNYSHQRKLVNSTDSTKLIYDTAVELFDEIWRGEPIRLLGVALSNLEYEVQQQISMFSDDKQANKNKALDKVIDELRGKFGQQAIVRSIFLENKK